MEECTSSFPDIHNQRWQRESWHPGPIFKKHEAAPVTTPDPANAEGWEIKIIARSAFRRATPLCNYNTYYPPCENTLYWINSLSEQGYSYCSFVSVQTFLAHLSGRFWCSFIPSLQLIYLLPHVAIEAGDKNKTITDLRTALRFFRDNLIKAIRKAGRKIALYSGGKKKDIKRSLHSSQKMF